MANNKKICSGCPDRFEGCIQKSHVVELVEGLTVIGDEEIALVKDCELEVIGESENYFAKQRAVDRAIAQAQLQDSKEKLLRRDRMNCKGIRDEDRPVGTSDEKPEPRGKASYGDLREKMASGIASCAGVSPKECADYLDKYGEEQCAYCMTDQFLALMPILEEAKREESGNRKDYQWVYGNP